MPSRPRSRPSPALGFVPCQPVPRPSPPAGDLWLTELKVDGFRILARRDGAGVRLITRGGNDWTDRYPAITAAIGALSCRSCVIDGEATICDAAGHPEFDALIRGRKVKPDALLYAFDLLELDGEDLRRRPIEERRRALELEGIVCKRKGSLYRGGASSAWVKVKTPAGIAAQRTRSETWDSR